MRTLLTPGRRSTAAFAALGALFVASACSGDGTATVTTSSSTSTTAPTTTVAATTTLAPTTTLPATTEAPTTTLPPTTTTEPLVTAGAVVLVANAAALPGAAAQISRQLTGLGFTVAEPTNAAGIEERLDVSKVYYLPEGEPVARSIVRLLGDVTLAPMPTPAWIVGATAALGDATVLLMLGADFAESGIPPH